MVRGVRSIDRLGSQPSSSGLQAIDDNFCIFLLIGLQGRSNAVSAPDCR